MNFLKLLFSLCFVFCFNSCQENSGNQLLKENDKGVNTVEFNSSDEKIVQTIEENLQEESPIVHVDSVCIYYNKVLRNLYPERELFTQSMNNPINVAPESLENIEGGGESREYLNVLNKENLVVGAIIYQTGLFFFPETRAIAILHEGTMITRPEIIDIDGRTILMTISTKNGYQDKGPYSFSFFKSYASSIDPRPIFKKVKSKSALPVLSYEERQTVLKNLNKVGHSTLFQDDFENLYKDNPRSEYFEENKYQLIVDELKGLEKYYVQNSFFRLHSLLKYKRDERYKALEKHLRNEFEEPVFFEIQLLDTKNGFVEFEALQAMECTNYSLCYWNKSNGDVLIGEINNCCTMFCEGHIRFQHYNKIVQLYSSIENEVVIPEYHKIKSLKPIGHVEGDGYDTKYTLPKNGKNIGYSADKNAIELVWKDGVFSIKPVE